jgi:pimeloyl-ACP methyl ester carboxylesterase
MTTDAEYLDRPNGRIAYDVTGSGPLMVCVPGMGELRSSFRAFVPALVGRGYRVATMDLRGHGDSDTGFDSYDDQAAASDTIALVEHLGAATATIVGSSMGAAAGALAAADRPDVVSDLILMGPFLRSASDNPLLKIAMRLLLARPWGRAGWRHYYASLWGANPPADLAEHKAAIARSLARPAYWRSFVVTATSGHEEVPGRLGDVHSHGLVVMGGRDRDFSDPATEARWCADQIGGEVLMIDDAGHYPYAEQPELVAAAVADYLGAGEARDARRA